MAFVSSSWNAQRGAITFWKHLTNLTGNVGPGNSLLGANSGDFVDSFFITDFFNGSYLVRSAHGGLGAVTLVNSPATSRGVVSASNSLIGTTAGDSIASLGVRNISGSTYGVFSPSWDNGGAVDAGAITMFDINTGNFTGMTTAFRGEINAGNSLVGTFAGDAVGAFARGNPVRILNAAGDYAAVFTTNWNGNRGAITWFTPGQALVGEISPANSLVGSFTDDFVGSSRGFGTDRFPSSDAYFLAGTANAFNLVASPNWHDGRGAITWLKPGQRLVGRVSANNSLVGAFAGDGVGDTSFHDDESTTEFGLYGLATGNFLLRTDGYHNGGGAITFINVARDLPRGVVTNGNSFVGAPGDQLGSGGLFALDGDRVLISSPHATVDGLAEAGRLDLFDGSRRQAVDQIGFGSDAADELAVSIPSVVNFLNDGGKLTLQASNDIFFPQGSNILAKGGSLTLEAGRSIEIKGNIVTGGFLRLHANAPGGDASQRETGEGFVSILADSSSTLVKANELEVEAEDVVVQGGTQEGAFAALVGVESAKIFAHGSGLVSLTAGTGTNLPPASSIEVLSALLDDTPVIEAPIAVILGVKSLDVNAAERIEMTGGGSTRAFASIASFGELTVASPDIQLKVGTADNTDAVFLGLGGAGDILFTTCEGCGDLLTDPILDTTSQTGTFLAGLFQDPTTGSILSLLPKDDEAGDGDDEDDKDKEGAAAECH